jgi:3-oxoacyl-[acyl-carrier protein] reductase
MLLMTISRPTSSTRRPRALVTGASRGIGRAIAARLAENGYDVTLTARDASALDEAATQLSELGGHVAVHPADMSDLDDVVALATWQKQLANSLDVLVLSAGVGTAGGLANYPLRRVERQLAVNLVAPFRLVQELLPALRGAATESPSRTAKIIALASITGAVSEPGLAIYGATKAALISLCESITVDEAGSGVTATAISPGWVDTDMSEWMHDELPAEEMITTADVAELAMAVCRLSRHAVVPNIVLTRPGPQLWRA